MSELFEGQGADRWDRRRFLKAGGALALSAGTAGLLGACGAVSDGNDGPAAASGGSSSGGTGRPIKLGFIPLTDCASLVMADKLGLFEKRGLNVQVIKQASWPATRDAMLNGDLDGAHCLFSMPLSIAAGIGGTKGNTKLKIAMVLNNNGQAITLKKELSSAGYADPEKAKAALGSGKGQTLAMTFPGGTHDIWLRYWLKSLDIDLSVPKIIPVPPPQMVANMKVGNMDGYCVGEPWGAVAVADDIGFTTITTQDIWEQHPEKALVVNENFSAGRKADLMDVMGAIIEASRFIDEPANKRQVAETIGTPAFVNAKPEAILPRIEGRYVLGGGLGDKTFPTDSMRFYRKEKTNAPRKGYAYWFLAQYQRLGYLSTAPDYKAIVDSIVLSDLYKEVAEKEGLKTPGDDMAPFEIKLDNTTFDPSKPDEEAKRA
jgi:nitrate/nitrite transport system substrate-binding protein